MCTTLVYFAPLVCVGVEGRFHKRKACLSHWPCTLSAWSAGARSLGMETGGAEVLSRPLPGELAWVCTGPGMHLAWRPCPAAGAETSLPHFGTEGFLFTAVGSGRAAESYHGRIMCPSSRSPSALPTATPGGPLGGRGDPPTPCPFVLLAASARRVLSLSLYCGQPLEILSRSIWLVRGARLKFSGCSRRGNGGGWW